MNLTEDDGLLREGAPGHEGPVMTAHRARLVGCRGCGRVWPEHETVCQRCGSALVLPDRRGLAAVWAWLAAGLIFYIPANMFPMLITSTLGGLRGKSRHLSPEVNGFWSNASFHNYADYATTPAFRAGLDHLIAEGRYQRCAIMCAESVWWRCHRRIVSDHLIARGERVFHIMGAGRVVPATLTSGAMVQPDGSVIYPIPNN